MSEGFWVLVAVLLVATVFGTYRLARDGRFRGSHDLAVQPDSMPTRVGGVLDGSGLDHELGQRATLLQFSSAFCAPCRATRRVLCDVAAVVPGVVHLEVDAEQHLELVRRAGVTRTPTTLILDHLGAELSRATGAPRKDDVLATLANALEDRTA